MDTQNQVRFDPRAVLRQSQAGAGAAARGALAQSERGRKGGWSRLVLVSAVLCSAGFGSLVAMATDDNSAQAFIMQQGRKVQQNVAVLPRLFQPRTPAVFNSYAPLGAVRLDDTLRFHPRDGVRTEAERSRPARAQADRDARRRVAARAAQREAAAKASTVSGPSGVTYCVRLCDGYFFPLSPAAGGERQQEAACAAMCPAAATRLYVGQPGQEIGAARAANGQRYQQLASAFNHQSGTSSACSCTARGWGTASVPLAEDRTLQPGDIVMTAQGLRIFEGGSRVPHRAGSFVRLSESNRLGRQQRARLADIERAALRGASPYAAASVRRDRAPVVIQRQQETRLSERQRVAAAGDVAGVRYVGPERALLR
jgi:hypothetical protein